MIDLCKRKFISGFIEIKYLTCNKIMIFKYSTTGCVPWFKPQEGWLVESYFINPGQLKSTKPSHFGG